MKPEHIGVHNVPSTKMLNKARLKYEASEERKEDNDSDDEKSVEVYIEEGGYCRLMEARVISSGSGSGPAYYFCS